MASRQESLGKYLAANIETLRAAHGLTQTELARRAGLPRSTVTNLESGDGNPSLGVLSTIAEALQVSIEELLAKPRADCQLVRSKDLSVKSYDGGKVRVFKLLPDPIQGLEIDRMELDAGGFKQGVPHLSGTKEYLSCVQGCVIVYVAGDSFQVEAGDVLAFPGDRAHSYRSASRGASVCYSVVSLTPRRKRR